MTKIKVFGDVGAQETAPLGPGSASYCTLLYGNSLIKAGSHTVELFSYSARNLCTAHQTLCVSPTVVASSRQVAGITHDLLTRIIKTPLLEDNNAPLSLPDCWSTDVTPTSQTYLLTHFRSDTNYCCTNHY